jgi:hypothetical protein
MSEVAACTCGHPWADHGPLGCVSFGVNDADPAGGVELCLCNIAIHHWFRRRA